MIERGRIVSFPIRTQLGKVSQVRFHPDPHARIRLPADYQSPIRPLYHVRLLDRESGKLIQCPDERCGGERFECPICAVNCWEHEISPVSDRDLAFYREEGLVE